MSYLKLQCPARSLILTLLLLLQPWNEGRTEEDLRTTETNLILNLEQPEAETPTAGADTHPLDRAELTNEMAQVVNPPVAPLPAITNIFQVQLPAIPMLAREDVDALVNRLVAVEQRVVEQQQSAMAMVVQSNRTALIVAGVLGSLGLLGILSAAIILVRAFNRVSDVMMTLPLGQQLGRGMSAGSMALEELHPTAPNALEQVSARFLGAMEQLEKRIRELEAGPRSANAPSGRPGNGNPRANVTSTTTNPLPVQTETGTGSGPADPKPRDVAKAGSEDGKRHETHRKVQALLEEGESLLHEDRLEEALTRFNDALALEPKNADALIKRGMTLERLQRMEAALESYDRAIATNGSLTLAYLHKGAICNRLQRYREALECYERALQAEQKP